MPINSFRTEKGGMDIAKKLTKSKIIILINLKRNIFISNYAYYVITTHTNKILFQFLIGFFCNFAFLFCNYTLQSIFIYFLIINTFFSGPGPDVLRSPGMTFPMRRSIWWSLTTSPPSSRCEGPVTRTSSKAGGQLASYRIRRSE